VCEVVATSAAAFSQIKLNKTNLNSATTVAAFDGWHVSISANHGLSNKSESLQRSHDYLSKSY